MPGTSWRSLSCGRGMRTLQHGMGNAVHGCIGCSASRPQTSVLCSGPLHPATLRLPQTLMSCKTWLRSHQTQAACVLRSSQQHRAGGGGSQGDLSTADPLCTRTLCAKDFAFMGWAASSGNYGLGIWANPLPLAVRSPSL